MNSKKSFSNNQLRPEKASVEDAFDLMVASITNEIDPLLQLDNIHDLSDLLKTTRLENREAKDLISALETASSKEGNTPLVSLGLAYLRDCIAVDYFRDKSAIKISKHLIDDLQNQEQLHKDYPALPNHEIIERFAPNIACSWDDYHRIDSTAFKGATNTISEGDDPREDPFLTLLESDEDIPLWVLNFAHDIRFRGLIEEKIGIDLAEVPLVSQIQLLKFMTLANNNRFDRLCGVLHGVSNIELRLKLAENFVAVDFGEDFGDALLDIASSEWLSDDKKKEILGTVQSCRESTKHITDLYTDFDDGKFAKEYAKATNERLTDALTVFRQIAKEREAEADLGWAGKPRFDLDEAIEALEYEAKSLKIIDGTLKDVKSGAEGAFAEVVLSQDKSLQRLNRTFYNFYSPRHGYVLLYTRPEGSHSFDPMTEYGKERSKYCEDSVNAGVEASISLITNPVDPFSLPSPFRPDRNKTRNPQYYDPITMNKVSAIRLDREGRTPGVAADDSSRDPLNHVGTISVDLAAIGDRVDTPSGKIARLLSVGNKLRGQITGVDSSLNHNTRWFDQDSYGTSSGFRRLVEYVDDMVLDWCSKSKPGDEAESFTKEMKRKRGKMARRVA